MDYAVLKKVVEYGDVYELAAAGMTSVEELKTALKKNGATGGTLQRRMDFLAGEPAYIMVDGDHIKYDYQALAEDLLGVMKSLIPLTYSVGAENVSEKDTKNQMRILTEENENCIKKMRKMEECIHKLKAELAIRSGEYLKTELERKVLVASSISVGPKENVSDECFLVDPEELLDVDACVARYGGELDSFYDEIPTDSSDTGYEPGHELTEKNHALRTMRTVGTKRFFEKRIRDNAEVKKIENNVGQLFPCRGNSRTERQRERDKILRNRFISINNIIKSTRLTNQEKLMMYAMNSEYHNTNVERLLIYAGAHCINANYLIYLLEDPDVCTTYENTVAFLSQFADASEYRMKLDLARELIEGKWYITADYNGRMTKFQLVPIEEFNELRKIAGLPISEFSYGDVKLKKLDRVQNDEMPCKPAFVENISSDSGTNIDIPEDGFSPPENEEEDYQF